MTYIRMPSAMHKLERADESFRPVIVLAPAGWGKTAAVSYHYRNKSALWLSGLSGQLDSMPAPDTIRRSVVIIDDISWLTDADSEAYILDLLRRGDRQIVLIGRGCFPAWLTHIAFDLDFVRIGERDFTFAPKQIKQMFENAEVPLSDADAQLIAEIMHGYPPAVKLCLTHVLQGQSINRELFADVRIDLFHFYEKAFFDRWKAPVRDLLLSVCRYPSFSPALATLLSGRQDVAELLEYCRNIGSFLERKSSEVYVLRDELLAFLRWKQELLWPKARIEENLRSAAQFFKANGHIPDALYYYKLAGASELIRQTLIENAEQHPGIGQYYELRSYYETLPKQLILESPALMAGMSMLCSLTMRPEESETWYRALEAYERQSLYPRELRKEAKARLAYLDIGLPHRAGKGLIGIFRRIHKLHQSENIKLPEFAATGNSPSLMNGGLDFCDWAKNGEQIARFMGKPVETLLGRFGKGLVNVSLAESGFERDTMTPYEVVTRLNNGYAAADHGGKIEICFAAQGVLIRQHLAEGQYPTAVRLLDVFSEKTKAEKAFHLLPNLEALSVWLSLYAGGSEAQERFSDSVADVHADFYIPNRFRYMTKIRCLIAKERYTEAMDLAGYLTHYFTEYGRTYLWIENELLKAILLYRQGFDEWQPVLLAALERAKSYHLVRVVSMEGGAILPLLIESTDASSDSFFKRLIERTQKTALLYPDYLKHTPKASVDLTAREQQILGLLLAGKSTEEICAALGIGYSGLKKHNRNIYAKLGVKTRAEAERTAIRLGLAHRGDGRSWN